MDDSRKYYEGRAAQCRRLVEALADQRAIEALTEMANEFDAKAAATPIYPQGMQDT